MKVLHPLQLRHSDVRWADVAALARELLTPESHAALLLAAAQERPYGSWVYSGQPLGMQRGIWAQLWPVLERHTASTSVVVGFSEEWAYGSLPDTERLTCFSGRTLALAEVPVRGLHDAPRVHGFPPSVVWPEDRSWFVHSDIEDFATYVGGSVDLAKDVLATTALECLEVRPEDPV